MERQYMIFIIAAGVGFAALLIVGLFFNPLSAKPADSVDGKFIEATLGKPVYVRYSSGVVSLVQKLPDKNLVRIEAPSQLLNTNLAGLKGEIRYSEMNISYVQNGKVEEVAEKDFKTIQYRFLPDPGNVTKYFYSNVEFNALATSSEIVATFVPLSTAKVGEEYPVKMVLEGGPVDIGIDEKIVKMVG